MMPFQRVQHEMHSQNDYITLKDMEETVDGCRRPVREVVKKVLASKNIKEAVLRKKEANLRFAADQRRTTCKKKTVMSVFSVMEESEPVGHNGLDQQNCIGVYDGDESCADSQGATKEIIAEMEDLEENGVDIEGQHIKLLVSLL